MQPYAVEVSSFPVGEMIGANNKQSPGVLARGEQHWFHQALLDSKTPTDLYLSPHITLTDATIPVESFAFCCIIPPAAVGWGIGGKGGDIQMN